MGALVCAEMRTHPQAQPPPGLVKRDLNRKNEKPGAKRIYEKPPPKKKENKSRKEKQRQSPREKSKQRTKHNNIDLTGLPRNFQKQQTT